MEDWIAREEDFERKPKKKLIHQATPICVANERKGVPIQTMVDWIVRGENFGRKPKKKLSGWVLSGANCKYEDAETRRCQFQHLQPQKIKSVHFRVMESTSVASRVFNTTKFNS